MGDLLCILVLLFQLAFLLRIVLSFFPLAPGGGVSSVRDLAIVVTDPLVLPIRRIVPPLGAGGAGIPVADILVLIGLQVIVGIIC
jgi:YggT family protein